MASVKKFKSGTGGLIPPGPLDPSAPMPPAPAAPSPNRLTPAYPILTEEVGYPPSPVSGGGNGKSRNGAGMNGRNGSLGPVVTKALQDVLGWKVKAGDATGFVGALNQSFALKTVEGAVVSTWTPRSYAVQSDLAGGLTGAQASIYTMAKTLVDQMDPLLDGLYALNPAADAEDIAAMKDIIHSQLDNLVSEIGYLGGPRVMRVHHYLSMLLGIKLHIAAASPPSLTILRQSIPSQSPLSGVALPPNSWTSPDTILGSLGNLRDLLGLYSLPVPGGADIELYVNTVADETDVTNFRILVDYANSLLNGWTNSFQYFAFFGQRQSPFLGTQLVMLSRQLGVIAEVVDEVRFVLDSVFIGPSQRQTLRVTFAPILTTTGVLRLPDIYLEDLLEWMHSFVGAEAQDVIQNAGKIGIGEDFNTMISQMYTQAYGLYLYSHSNPALPIGTTRVQESLYKLLNELSELYYMAAPVGEEYFLPAPQE
jgi:hypothetical protein